MLRGTKHLTRQQIQDALDKNFARLGGGMGGMRLGGGGLGRAPVVLDPDQARQPARRAGDPPPGPPRAHPAGGRVRGHEERAARRPRAGQSDPMRPGAQPPPAPPRRYPADDVRYVPTTDEEIERVKAVTVEQVRDALSRLPGRQPRRAVGRRRLRAFRGPVRSLAGPSRAGRAASPSPGSSGRSSPT